MVRGPAPDAPQATGKRGRPQDLVIRTISSLVMGPLALLSAWYGGWYFAAPLLVITLYATYEWNRMSGVAGLRLLTINAVALWTACYLLVTGSGLHGIAALAFGAACAGLFSIRSGLAFWSMAGLLYLGLAALCLVWLRESHGPWLTIWLLFLVWASDIAAYITGSLFGGPKLAPRLSPSKTWSGLIGGGSAAAVVCALFGHYAGLGPPVTLGLVGFALACWSQLGDIVESTIKRRFNVKDSGQLIPGHGGVLDRIDSLAFTVVLVAGALYAAGLVGVALYD